MAEKSLSVLNFKFGLDGRRSELTSVPGTLKVCENAHIGPGGEIEKRLAFVPDANLLPSNTFGLQNVADGMEVYGSDSAPNAALPVDVAYVRLQHPTVLDGGGYDAAYHNMVAVPFSVGFLGNSFVGASFSDGRTFLYYAGVLVDSSRNGLVLEGATGLADLAVALARQINALGSGWIAIPNVDESGNASNGDVIIKSAAGVYYTLTCSNTSTAGLLGSNEIDRDQDGVTGVGAIALFLVLNGSGTGTFTLTAPKYSDGSGIATLCSAVACGGSATLTATAIKNAVNAWTSLTGYTATTDGADTVSIYAPVDWGDASNTFQLTVTTTGDADSGASSSGGALSAYASPSGSFINEFGTATRKNIYSDLITAIALGGTAPYTYAWTEDTLGSGNHIVITNLSNAATKFYQNMVINTNVSGTFKCVVTDTALATVTIGPVLISLSYDHV